MVFPNIVKIANYIMANGYMGSYIVFHTLAHGLFLVHKYGKFMDQ